MQIHGTIVDVGNQLNGRGVQIQLSPTHSIEIVGLTKEQTREFARMFFHRVVVTIESKDDAERFRNEETPAPKSSNIDEATGIKKTGPI